MKKTKLVAAVAASMAFAAPAFAGMTVAQDGDSKLSVGAKMFADFSAKKPLVLPGQVAPAADTTGLNLTRFYFDVKYKKDAVWSVRFTTDTAAEALGKANNVFVKYAYIQGHFDDAAVLRLGMSHTPWIDYEQHLWKHRFVAKVTTDEFKFDDSADAGIGLKGKVADGMVNYWITATNGGGYGKAASATGSIDYNSRISVAPVKGLDLSAQYRTGYRGKKASAAVANPAAKEKLAQFMASYGTDEFRVGGNYISVKNFGNTVANDITATALWGWAHIDNVGAFAKIENNKDKAVSPTKRQRFVVGADYFVSKGVTLSLAYIDDKTTKAGANTAGNKQYGLFTQFTF
ncbi:MAG: hypothetical protein HQM07_01100 [Zetaproteobacteria bacterium]|nr:hypothetical protein [Zetaproteobacteria bacterium]